MLLIYSSDYMNKCVLLVFLMLSIHNNSFQYLVVVVMHVVRITLLLLSVCVFCAVAPH